MLLAAWFMVPAGSDIRVCNDEKTFAHNGQRQLDLVFKCENARGANARDFNLASPHGGWIMDRRMMIMDG